MVPTSVHLEGFLTVVREKSMKMLFLDEILWILEEIFEQISRTRVKKVKIDDFWSKKWNFDLHLDRQKAFEIDFKNFEWISKAFY